MTNVNITSLIESVDFTTGVTQYQTPDGILGVKAVYRLKNPLKQGKQARTELTVHNASIIQSIEIVNGVSAVNDKLGFAMCRELYKLSTEQNLKIMGFKNPVEMGKSLFDIGGVTVRQYIKIGKLFVTDDYKPSVDIFPTSITRGHMIELLAVFAKSENEEKGWESISDLYAQGVLHDGMSTMAYRKAIKSYFEAEEAIDTEGTEESVTSAEEAVLENENGEEVPTLATVAGQTHKAVSDAINALMGRLTPPDAVTFQKILNTFEGELVALMERNAGA